MIEGIIQKVISKWRYANSKTTIGEYEIHQLKQELIEAIKQEFNNIHYNRNNKELVGFYKVWIDYFTRKLIGDNQ